jgi:hypothetical protein
MPAWQIAKPKISDSNAEKIFDAVSDDLEHAPNLAIDSLPQDNAKARRRQGMNPRNFRALAIKNHAAQQLRSEHRVPRSIQRDLVLLVYLEAGVGEPLRQFAVICQKQQTFSLSIQTTDVEQAGKFFRYQIKDGISRVEILSSRNESSGLMQHDRKRWSDVNEFVINLYMIARPRLRAEVRANSAIDCDAACSDQLIAMPA